MQPSSKECVKSRVNDEDIYRHFEKQLVLLKKEKDADYAQYQARMMNTSITERVQNGVTWYPIQIESDFASTGDRLTLEVRRTKNIGSKHAFQAGVVVGLFGQDAKEAKVLQGVVGYVQEDRMRIVLNQGYLPDWLHAERLGVNLLFDDGTYREMNKAIKTVMSARNDRIAELRSVFFGLREASNHTSQIFDLPSLNKMQNEAFAQVSNADDVAFVHGPPGTGKTTTLVKSIKEVVRTEKQVLVCAPSNAAVDLLVERLVGERLRVLRLGHPARLTPEVIENSLDVKVSKHKSFFRLKELRKKAEEMRFLAGKYKRNFGKGEREQRKLMYRESRLLKQECRELESYITESLVDDAEVVACTLIGAAQGTVADRFFKTVFIDESSQAMEAAAWIPILRGSRIIMSGDHHQLPPTIKSFEAAKAGLEYTLFARGIETQPRAVTMLETQYRMEPTIMNFSSEWFYDNRLEAATAIAQRLKKVEGPLLMVDTAGAGFEEQIKKETLSTYNVGEADLLVKLMEVEIKEDLSVGVIVPYRAQVEQMKSAIQNAKKLTPFLDHIDINSVDAFQGQERDVIYMSLVRSNSSGEIGFLKEYRRMNVAITRARFRLVVVGDSSTLGQDPFFAALIKYFQQYESYKSIYELAFWEYHE
ncbi:MAG: AAA domain-containing protein [Bacteroidota bacterium]